MVLVRISEETIATKAILVVIQGPWTYLGMASIRIAMEPMLALDRRCRDQPYRRHLPYLLLRSLLQLLQCLRQRRLLGR
jgi:hypothetical protein